MSKKLRLKGIPLTLSRFLWLALYPPILKVKPPTKYFLIESTHVLDLQYNCLLKGKFKILVLSVYYICIKSGFKKKKVISQLTVLYI